MGFTKVFKPQRPHEVRSRETPFILEDGRG